MTYHLGPGPATVHLKLEFDFAQKPLYDVIATLKGRERPDEWVIRGNHHDAWVNGAEDPVSGLVAMLAEARRSARWRRAAGGRADDRLRRVGRRGAGPAGIDRMGRDARRRSCSRRRSSYINSDGNGRGFLGVGGSHGLERFVNEVASA